MSDKRWVLLPEDFLRAAEFHLVELGASSVEAWLEQLVRERLTQLGILSPLTPDEQADVEDQLKRLGYME